MVYTSGNYIVSAFTSGVSVKEIYTNGVKVWPSGPGPGEYYVKWRPSSVSGSFIMGGETRLLQTYNGYYSGPFLSSNGVYYMDSQAFVGTGITGVETNLPMVGGGAFTSVTTLQYARMSQCEQFGLRSDESYGTNVFFDCTSLNYLYLPKLKKIKYYTFTSCEHLQSINLPKCEAITMFGFASCSNLIDISLPECRLVGLGAFQGCSMLSTISLPVCSQIRQQAFENCTNLSTIYLGYSGVVSFSTSWVHNTPIGAGNGSIYVPLEWVSEYKTGYPAYSSVIFPIPN